MHTAFYLFIFNILYLWVFAWSSLRPEEGIWSIGTRVADGCGLLYVGWKPNHDSAIAESARHH